MLALLLPFCIVRINRHRRVAALDMAAALEAAAPLAGDLVEVQFVEAPDALDALLAVRADIWVRWR